MFCTHCGAHLTGGERFCPGCGAALQPAEAARPGVQQPLPAAPQGPAGQGWQQPAYAGYMPSRPPRAARTPWPDAYYVQEFEKVAATGKGSFNWAAFFFGPFHCLYRGCVPRFLKLYLPIWAAGMAAAVFVQMQAPAGSGCGALQRLHVQPALF